VPVAGEVLSYLEMCSEEGVNLQRGMNYRIGRGRSVFLMSVRKGAPYADRVEEGGRVLIYEGHDEPSVRGGPDPKTLDQPRWTPQGNPTQNGLFYRAATEAKSGGRPPEQVHVYEKIRAGIWVYNGVFKLVDAWLEPPDGRQVFRFRLEIIDVADHPATNGHRTQIDHTRLIPSAVKLEVWRRDHGRCVTCGASDNLHFDHVIPYSKGGSSLVAENIQLLCARHNLEKRDHVA